MTEFRDCQMMQMVENASMGYLFWRWMSQYCNTVPNKKCHSCGGGTCECASKNVSGVIEPSLYPCEYDESCSFGACMMGYGAGHPNGPCAWPIDNDDDDP